LLAVCGLPAAALRAQSEASASFWFGENPAWASVETAGLSADGTRLEATPAPRGAILRHDGTKSGTTLWHTDNPGFEAFYTLYQFSSPASRP